MDARVKLAVAIAACLLAFGGWLVFVWLPPEAAARRDQLLGWLVLQLLVTVALLWWAFGIALTAALARQTARFSGALARAGLVTPNPSPASLDELAQSVETLRQRAAQSETALAEEKHVRREAESALRDTQERYALAVRAADDGLWEWSIESGAMYLSPRWKSMLGFAESELDEGFDAWQARVHPDDRASVRQALQTHVAGESPRFENEHRLLHKDGSARWVHARGTALRHASGKAYRVIGLDSDISTYKRIEATLQHVAAGTANTVGVEFYRAMVMHFAHALNVSEVFVTECVDHPPTRVRTLACWERGQFIVEEYDLAPTPCKIVFDSKDRYFVPRDLAVHFPNELPYGFASYLGMPILDSRGRVLGHLVFKDDKPMDESILMDSVYRIFTARAGAEMQRALREKGLLRMAQGFSEIKDARERLGALVGEFAKYMGAREAFITRCLNEPPTRVRALCYWNNGELAYDVDYDLAGNPCEQVYGDAKALYWPKLLAERWPLERQFNRDSYLGLPLTDPASGRALGHLACCDDKPMSEEKPDPAVLALFTERAREELLACLGTDGSAALASSPPRA